MQVNEVISQIVDMFEVNDPDALKEALNQRENDLCDALRERAAANGLMPSTVALELIQLAMGDRPDEATVELLTAQAAAEQAHLAELQRRLFGQ